MTEVYNRSDLQAFVLCGEVRIDIPFPSNTLSSIIESEFDMMLVERAYAPDELPGIISATSG